MLRCVIGPNVPATTVVLLVVVAGVVHTGNSHDNRSCIRVTWLHQQMRSAEQNRRDHSCVQNLAAESDRRRKRDCWLFFFVPPTNRELRFVVF